MSKISGNAVAITVAGLALVLAAGGTTYAVATSKVSIADATTPTRVATVDNTGHLVTTGSVSTIDAAGYLTNYTENSWNYLTSPTTASLAITRMRLSNPGRNDTNEEQLGLYKVGVDGSGNCSTSGQTLLGYYDLSSGDESVDGFDSPLQVRSTGGAKYCLAVYIVSTTPNQGFYITYSLAAYAVTGTYTGIGANTNGVAAVSSGPGLAPGEIPAS